MSYLNLKLGCSQKKAVITNIEVRTPKGSKKIYLRARSNDGKEYTINEVWTKNRNNESVTQGLWMDTDIDGQICVDSTLGRFLNFMGVHSIGDLITKEIDIGPKSNGFMSILMN
jgi:hypothetical protein